MSTSTFLDRGPTVLAVTTTTLVCASVFVFGRLLGRIAIVKHVGWDDYFIILSWVGCLLGEELRLRLITGRYLRLGCHSRSTMELKRALGAMMLTFPCHGCLLSGAQNMPSRYSTYA
jgi:hypothetical protein